MVASDCTVVIISHSQSLLEMICDRIMCLHKGMLDCITEDKKDAINRYHELSSKGWDNDEIEKIIHSNLSEIAIFAFCTSPSKFIFAIS